MTDIVILTHMHDTAFWSQLMDFIHRSLSPGRLYGALIQPRFDSIKPTKLMVYNLQGQLVDKSDLESLISREGYNQVFMAGWYREYEKLPTFKVFDIVQFGKRTCWKMT